jgi:hypothetical protein
MSKTFKDYPVYDASPFDHAGIHEVEYKRRIKKGQLIYTDTGEVTDIMQYKESGSFTKDSLTYVKMYKAAIGILPGLSKASVSVLCICLKKLKPNTGEFVIKHKDAVSMDGTLKYGRYYDGMSELLEYGVIAKGKLDKYYINTNLFFNGDRIKGKK